jgi:lysophospholipase L1-like esterase
MNSHRVGELVYKSSFSLATFFILLILIEAGSYILFLLIPQGSPYPVATMVKLPLYAGQPWANEYWREDFETSDYAYNYAAYVVWRMRPFDGKMIHINQSGWRRTVHSDCEHPDMTIWTFGGSTLWGQGSPDEETIPSFLADDYQLAGRHVCVQNFGVRGWNNTQEVIQLMLLLKHSTTRPNLVLFYDGANDVLSFYQSGKPDVHEDYDTIKRELETRPSRGSFAYLASTNTYQLLIRLKRRIWNSPPPSPHFSAAQIHQQLDWAYLQNLEIVDALAKGYGFHYAFFWQPVIYFGKPLALGEEDIVKGSLEEMPALDALYRRSYEQIRNSNRPHLFDLEDVFQSDHDAVYFDVWHVGPDGNRRVARRMYEALKQQGW